MPFCAVPTDTPNRPVSGAIPSAGPYYVASATPGRSFVLLRNPNYHGDRPHRLQRIEIIVGAPHPVAQIEASKLDYAIGGVPAGESARLERLYGAHSAAAGRGRQRYFVNRTLSVDYLDLNTRRPLFASARMRRAASYAVDRSALAATGGSFSTAAAPAQMSIPPGMPGYRDAHVYPLVPDLASARRLAGSGHHDAELYCVLEGGGPQAAQIIKNNLAAIGIDVHVHCMPGDELVDTHVPPERALGHRHRRLRRQLQRPRRVHQRTRNRQRVQLHATTTTPGSAEGSAPPHASPAFPAPRPTPRSTWHSRETPCPGSTSPT